MSALVELYRRDGRWFGSYRRRNPDGQWVEVLAEEVGARAPQAAAADPVGLGAAVRRGLTASLPEPPATPARSSWPGLLPSMVGVKNWKLFALAADAASVFEDGGKVTVTPLLRGSRGDFSEDVDAATTLERPLGELDDAELGAAILAVYDTPMR